MSGPVVRTGELQGVEDRHHDAVGAALIQTLETALGAAFTPRPAMRGPAPMSPSRAT